MDTILLDQTWDEPDLGFVLKKTYGVYAVFHQKGVIDCELASGLRRLQESGAPNGKSRQKQRNKKRQPADPIAVGDVVRFCAKDAGRAQILEILPRQNRVSRRSAVPMPSATPFEQVIAANVDQVVPVFAAADPMPKWNLLDRYLVSAEAAGIPALILITKLDLVQDTAGEIEPALLEAFERYRRAGYPVILVSSVTGEGLAEFRQALHGKLSVFLGKSGVGKTSLLNALRPGLGLRVNQVSQATGKGKHTTTQLEIFSLDERETLRGGAIVDTPGIREFGVWDVRPNELADLFPEMRPYLGSCRFGLDCRHDEEPGCEIRKAVMDGQISPYRWKSYLQLRYER